MPEVDSFLFPHRFRKATVVEGSRETGVYPCRRGALQAVSNRCCVTNASATESQCIVLLFSQIHVAVEVNAGGLRDMCLFLRPST